MKNWTGSQDQQDQAEILNIPSKCRKSKSAEFRRRANQKASADNEKDEPRARKNVRKIEEVRCFNGFFLAKSIGQNFFIDAWMAVIPSLMFSK